MNRPRHAGSFIALCLTFAALAAAQDNAADAAKLIDALQLQPGMVVAEIGAGAGDLTIAIGKHVGASGRIYTNELRADRIQRLRAAVEKSGLSHVQVIDGHEARTNLPDACCDAVFMRNVYHHFDDPAAMHASFLRALKPGGRVAVIDFPPRRFDRSAGSNTPATAPPGKRGEDGAHGVSAEVVATEMKAAGLEIVSSEDRPGRWFIVVGRKPAP